jgi:RsiW-degrading membrane proteinase PrsW (M82 family)
MGHTLLLLVAMFMGYLAAKRTTRTEPLRVLVNSLISGLIVGGFFLVRHLTPGHHLVGLIRFGEWIRRMLRGCCPHDS